MWDICHIFVGAERECELRKHRDLILEMCKTNTSQDFQEINPTFF